MEVADPRHSAGHPVERGWRIPSSGGGANLLAGAPPPPTQRRGRRQATGAPPPSTRTPSNCESRCDAWRPDPASVYVAGRNQGTFFTAPRRRPATRPDRSLSLERLTKGIAVMGPRSPRTPQPVSPSSPTPGCSRQSSARQLHTVSRESSAAPSRRSPSPTPGCSRQSSARPLHSLSGENSAATSRQCSAPPMQFSALQFQCSVATVERSSSCQSERSQRPLEGRYPPAFPRNESPYSLRYMSPVEQMQATKVYDESRDQCNTRANCTSDESPSKVPMMSRRPLRLQAQEARIDLRTGADAESSTHRPHAGEGQHPVHVRTMSASADEETAWPSGMAEPLQPVDILPTPPSRAVRRSGSPRASDEGSAKNIHKDECSNADAAAGQGRRKIGFRWDSVQDFDAH